MNTTSFAEQLRADRRATGLTQDELSERTGVSQSAISHLEVGTRSTPDQVTVEKLQTVLPLTGWTAARALFETLARKSGQTVDEVITALLRGSEDYKANPPVAGRADYDVHGNRIADDDTSTPVATTVSDKHPADWVA